VVVKGNASEVQLRALEREAKVQREQLESYLSRYREAAARDGESATPADARIVSRAVTPEVPSFPKKLPIIGFATLLTLMLAAGGVLARALLAESARNAAERDAAFEPSEDHARREPVVERPDFAFPETMPLARWSGKADGSQPSAAHPKAPAPSADEFDLAPLVARITSGPRREEARSGRLVLIMETEETRGAHGLSDALTRAFGAAGSLVAVDLNMPVGADPKLGFTDLVAGQAAFLDVIQARRDRGLHRIEAGQRAMSVLFDEPDALALTFEAMAEAYDWVVCQLHAAPGAVDLLELVAGYMDSVVIASNASAEDPALRDLYAIAEEAGAGQILVAQDRPAMPDVVGGDPRAELRLNAA
jgi:hypothetical protein